MAVDSDDVDKLVKMTRQLQNRLAVALDPDGRDEKGYRWHDPDHPAVLAVLGPLAGVIAAEYFREREGKTQ